MSDEKKDFGKWQPLVPANIANCELDTDGIKNRKNPQLEKAFKDLYVKQHLEEKDKFSLLYSTAEEDESEKIESRIETDADEREQEPDELVAAKPEVVDIEAIKKKAFEEGFLKGEAEGYEAGLNIAQEKTERLSLILNEVEVLWQNLFKTNETKIVELIAKIAEKVVYGRVEVDNEIIIRSILDVFDKIPDPVNVTLTVNPDDYDYIEVVKDDFFEKIKGLKQVSIVSDQMIDVGGCRIETSSGEVDTNIEERLDAVKKSIISVAISE